VSRRRYRILGIVVLLAVALALAGLAWRYVDDQLEYRRVVAFFDTVAELRDSNATTEEVRDVLGDPEYTLERPGELDWFYSGGFYRGRRQRTVVVTFDPGTSRLISVSEIVHN